LIKRTEVIKASRGGRAWMNEGEAVHSGCVRIHLARVKLRLRAPRAFISPKEAGAPITRISGRREGTWLAGVFLSALFTFARLSESPAAEG
jgi:hypothetical protein